MQITFTEWAKISAVERARWYAYFRLKPEVEALLSYDDLDITLAEFRELTNDQKKALSEYDTYRAELEHLNVTRKDYIYYDPVWRKAKLEMARKSLRMHEVG